MFKFLGVVGSLGAIVALGLLIDTQSRSKSQAESREPEFLRIAAPGRIEGVTPPVELRPERPGRVVEILVKENQKVTAGELLLRLDDELAKHEVAFAASEIEEAEGALDRLMNGARLEEIKQAAAQLEIVKAKLLRAKRDWERISPLLEQGAATPQEGDQVYATASALSAEVEAAAQRLALLKAPPREDEVRMARARVGEARARWKQAATRQEQTRLYAPSSGTILEIDPEVGEMIGPDTDRPAIVMADTTQFFVRAFVEELDAPRVQVGMEATITADGLPNRQLTGCVSRMSPRMDEKVLRTNHPGERLDTKVREVWIELDKLEDSADFELVVGLRVDVLIDPHRPLRMARHEAPADQQSSRPGNRQSTTVPRGSHAATDSVGDTPVGGGFSQSADRGVRPSDTPISKQGGDFQTNPNAGQSVSRGSLR